MPIVKPDGSRISDAAMSEPRVLVVDDQLVIRGAIRSALDKLERHFLIIETDTGEEALAIMQSAKVDIIFCDIQLPGISGPEALAHAYGNRDQRPFMVLMSGKKGEAIHDMGRRIGVYEFMGKPFRAGDVIHAIQAFDRLKQVARVLVIDDSATVRRLMSRILDRSQFHIDLHEACSGAEALRLAKSASFDVIFCDFNMPGLDGVETAGLLLRLNPSAQIVLISTEQPSSLVRSAQFVGAFAFLKKPFDAADIDAVMHDAFALKRPSISRPTHAIFSNEDALRARGEVVTGTGNSFGSAGVS
jgi:two-component system, chemotaxis family, chemotaxis protein CheY